jgi:hypothetical protein
MYYHPQPMTSTQNDGKDITLYDVMAHLQGMKVDMRNMEARLSTKIDTQISASESRLSIKIDTMETHLTQRLDALEEDLVATMKDTRHIRQHVGIANPDE